jgi:hypothetical protein
MSPAPNSGHSKSIFARIVGAEDLPRTESGNGLRIILAVTMSKIGDGLIDPKLVLSWLLTALGAPAYFIGALVPIREAGALLPQLLLASGLGRMRHRKWMWVAGSALQGAAALAVAFSGLVLSGWMAGLAICAALAVLAVARSACSVSFKEVLGKSVSKTHRGAVTGFAGSVASAAVVVFAMWLIFGVQTSEIVVVGAVAGAGLLWLLAALVFAGLTEQDSRRYYSNRSEFRRLLHEDWYLRRFILVRGLLVSTALAPPYLVLLSAPEGGAVLEHLGALVLASALASLLSSYFWGRLSDWSSRRVLCLSGLIGGLAMAAMVVLARAGLVGQAVWLSPLVLFVLMIAYHGVRQARSTYLVDMAPRDFRGAYSAVVNTMIGTILLVAGLFGGVLSYAGPDAALVGFAAMSLLGAGLALTLREVEKR